MSYVKVLGSSGSKSKNGGTTSFFFSNSLIIDAGNIINILGDEACKVENILLTHSHLDHISDIPFLLDRFFETRVKPLTIFASDKTISNLKNSIFNGSIWPDFSKIKLPKNGESSLIFKSIEAGKEFEIDDFKILPILANHSLGSFGFVVKDSENSGILISGDTYLNDDLTNLLNEDHSIKTAFFECSFPNRYEALAKTSKHLTPKLLFQILGGLKRELNLFAYHLKDPYKKELENELKELSKKVVVLKDEDKIDLSSGKLVRTTKNEDLFEKFMDINLQLSSELNKDKLYEMILTLTRELTDCDAGTLYILKDDKRFLEFKVVQNDTLNTFLGGKGEKIPWNPLPLYLENGEKNRSMVAVMAALENKIINIKDAYDSKDFNFEGTKNFDKQTGYRSSSMLVAPLVNHEEDVIGVIQLINKKGGTFTNYDERVLKALSSQAAMALTNTQLILSLEQFLEGFVTSIANAIDAKSAHTSTHITKMSILAPLIAKSLNEDDGFYKDVRYSQNDIKEIELAAKLHDIGKISIPEHIVDKATKLHRLIDAVELVGLRKEVIKRDLEIAFLKNELSKEEFEVRSKEIDEDFDFIARSNMGCEFMKDEDIKKLKDLSSYTFMLNGKKEFLLKEDEVEHLCIRRGTLTDEEKGIMNSHANLSYEMLSSLDFPKKYSNVMHIAVNHHEKLNGTGYPRGLREKDLKLEDRILILADIFEALASNDRPYKGTKKLSEIFRILDFMAKDGEIDKDLLEFFKKSQALEEFKSRFLLKEQLDV